MSTTYSGRGSLRIARMGVLFAVMTNWLACGGDPGNQQQQDSGMVVVPPGNKPVGANCAAARHDHSVSIAPVAAPASPAVSAPATTASATDRGAAAGAAASGRVGVDIDRES